MNLEDYDKLPDTLPILVEDNMFIYPFMIVPIFISDKLNIKAIDYAMENNKLITVVLSKKTENKTSKEFYNIGVAGTIMRKVQLPDNRIKILFQGLEKVTIKEITNENPLSGVIDVLKENEYDKQKIETIMNILKEDIDTLSKLNPKFPIDLVKSIDESLEPSRIIDLISSVLSIDSDTSFGLFRETDVEKRLYGLIDIVKKEIENFKLQSEINKKVNTKLDKAQKDYFLKEQLRTIRKELGHDENKDQEITAYYDKLENLKPFLPEDGYKEVKNQIDKLGRIHNDSSEANTIQTYIEEVFKIPFDKTIDEDISIEEVEVQLNKDHYSLKEPKDRITEFFAVKQLREKREVKNDTKNSTVICFVGPPGVGKTSLANSISKALKRPLVRVALGGLEDVNELRGHRRTYVGAMPGRIVQGLSRAEAMNPVVVLDEIDKIGANHKGDPSAVMLEILDPEQNNAFRDLYLNFEIDLSRCVFIATANSLSSIPAPLKDRMEFISIDSYTPNEKFYIAKDYLIPQELKRHGLKKSEISLSKSTINLIIEKFTREAGVRNLRRVFSKIFRKVVKKIVSNEEIEKIIINRKNIEEYLDNPVFEIDKADNKNSVGVVNGLAWTSVGGDVLKIETAKFTGKGNLMLTGNMGDVMKESTKIAHSVIKSLIDKDKLPKVDYGSIDIHMHIPEGATPKDGPSAGIAMALAIASTLCDKKVYCDIAMTGEITLTGKVLPIGGLKEKLIAAHKAKIKKVLIPFKNYKRDLKDIPQEVKEDMEIIAVKEIKEVLEHGLV